MKTNPSEMNNTNNIVPSLENNIRKRTKRQSIRLLKSVIGTYFCGGFNSFYFFVFSSSRTFQYLPKKRAYKFDLPMISTEYVYFCNRLNIKIPKNCVRIRS